MDEVEFSKSSDEISGIAFLPKNIMEMSYRMDQSKGALINIRAHCKKPIAHRIRLVILANVYQNL